MQHIISPFKYSLVQEPVYHGTNQWFSNFSHSVDIGFHFGTESAANDRIGRVGVVEFDIEENLPESTPRFRSESVKRIYDLLVTKLQNPRKDLPDELNSMSDSELNDVYNEFSGAQSIQSTNDSRPIGYTIKANGEALTTVDTESEAKYIMKQLTKWAKQPRKFWVDVQNPIRMPDLGTWGVGDIAKHARLTQPEIVELFDQDSSNRYEWLRDKLKAKGYDSIVYSNSVEDKGSDSYIVFDATQIKEIDKNHLMEAIYSAHPYKSPRHSELTPDEHNIRNTAYAIKKAGSPELVSAATDMAKYVNPQTILVPMPSSKGDVSANKELADAIAKISGASVVDAIGIKAPRVSNRDLELSGRTRLTAKKMGFVLRQSLDSRNVMFVDNVAASGATIQAAQNLINGGDGLVYAKVESTEGVADEVYPYDFPGDVYHVTYYRNLESISDHGLLPNQQSSIGGVAYDGHRENKIFVCGAGDISYWYELAEEWAGDKSDDPMNDGFLPIILRVSCGDVYVDDAAVDDGCDESFYTLEPVGPSDLDMWVGGRWVPVDQYDGIDIARAFDEDGYFVRNNPYALIESIDRESLHAKFSQLIDSPDDIHYLGKGDFGEAYQISSDKVLKITTSKSEYELSKIQLDKKLSNLVTVYACFEYGSDYVIIMELLDQPQKIESLFYEVESIIETQGVDISNISYFDDDEYSSESGEIDTATTDFMNELSAVVYDYKRISEIPDIQPNNLGYDTNGVLKAFDLEDKASLRSNRR